MYVDEVARRLCLHNQKPGFMYYQLLQVTCRVLLSTRADQNQDSRYSPCHVYICIYMLFKLTFVLPLIQNVMLPS